MKSRHRRHIMLSVLVSRDGPHWVAQALERDFAAHGPTQGDAIKALGHVILGHLRLTKPKGNADPLADVPPAPEEFWEAWEAADLRREVEELIPGDNSIPPAYIAQAVSTLDSMHGR